MHIFIKIFLAIILTGSLLLNDSFGQANESAPKNVRQTNWEVSPSLKYDTICFLNILTGDPFYLRFYQAEYDRFAPRITPAARQALANLKRKIKDEQKNIVSAELSLYFSATDDENISDMLKTLRNTDKMHARLKASAFYNEKDWQTFESVKKDLRVIFLFLKDIKFERYWKRNILPEIRRKIAEIKPDLPKYNVINEVETLTGYRFPFNKITAYVLRYPQPHGLRVTGLRFLMSDSYPFERTIFIATHELTHEPVRKLVNEPGDTEIDVEMRTVLDTLRADEFLSDKIKNHDISLGYNNFEALINEDITQALDQTICEKLGVEKEEAHKRWKTSDEGIHVFAVAVYSLMKEEKFPQNGENIRAFILRMFRSGRLSAGKIRPLYDKFYAETATESSKNNLPKAEWNVEVLIAERWVIRRKR